MQDYVRPVLIVNTMLLSNFQSLAACSEALKSKTMTKYNYLNGIIESQKSLNSFTLHL